MKHTTAPQHLVHDGQQYRLMNSEWAAEKIDEQRLERAAARLDLDMTAQEVVQRIVDFVREHGPVGGRAVVGDAFSDKGEGAVRMEWTIFFKQACNELGMLRYKKEPVTRSSRVVFAFPDQVAE